MTSVDRLRARFRAKGAVDPALMVDGTLLCRAFVV